MTPKTKLGALSARSTFVELRGFVKEHGLCRNGMPLKATRKAELYEKIVAAWNQRHEDGASNNNDAPMRPKDDSMCVLVDTVFADRFEPFKMRFPFFNGLGSEMISARVNDFICERRVADGTLLYVGTSCMRPEHGMRIVNNGKAETMQSGDSIQLYRELVARGVLHRDDDDGTIAPECSSEHMRQMMNASFAAHGCTECSPSYPPSALATAPAGIRQSIPRRRWQHAPVQLVRTDDVLHPPTDYVLHPPTWFNRGEPIPDDVPDDDVPDDEPIHRKMWEFKPVTLRNADKTSYPRAGKHNPNK